MLYQVLPPKENKTMKKLWFLVAVLVLSFGMASVAQADTVVIGFENLTLGSSYASIVYPGVTFTYIGSSNNILQVQSSPGPPLSGNVILGGDTYQNTEWYKATMAVETHSVSVDMGDYNADIDSLVLKAFDSANNLLATDTFYNPANVYGGHTLSVSSSTAIAYLLFNEVNDPLGSPYQGSIYFDNFTYSTPEPTLSLLLGIGFGAVVLGTWRKKKA